MEKTQAEIAREMAKISGWKYNSAKARVWKILQGKIHVPEKWADHFHTAAGCSDQEEFVRLNPKVKFKKPTIMGMAENLAKLLNRDSSYPRGLATHLGGVLNGEFPVPRAWEAHIATALGCKTREELSERFPLIRFSTRPTTHASMARARKLVELTGNKNPKAPKTWCTRLRKVLNGEDKVPRLWEAYLATVMGCKSREELSERFPLIRFREQPTRRTTLSIARSLARSLKKEVPAKGKPTIYADVSRVLNGRIRIPRDWVQHFRFAAKCKNKKELKKLFPKIKFPRAKKKS